MLPKLIAILLLAAILVSLASGMFYLVKDRGESKRTMKALTFRIGLSVLLFVLLIIGFATGYLHPHGINPGR
ncbi:MAG: twin transmembrane helix small protein [Gammaproteobacteria bacterium]|jgi:hypothetical protein